MQVNAISDAFDAYLTKRVAEFVVVTAAHTAAAGEHVEVNGASGSTIAVTLPAAPAADDVIEVTNVGAGSATVQAAGGIGILGVGLSSTASFPLNELGSHMRLKYDGTHWIACGSQNTGWVTMTPLASGVSADASTPAPYPPAYRVEGRHLELRGGLFYAASGGITNIFTLPVVARPAQRVGPVPVYEPGGVGNGVASIQIAASGVITLSVPSVDGFRVSLDNLRFSLT